MTLSSLDADAPDISALVAAAKERLKDEAIASLESVSVQIRVDAYVHRCYASGNRSYSCGGAVFKRNESELGCTR